MKISFEINVLSHIEKDKIEPYSPEDKRLLQEFTYKNTLGNKNFVNVLRKLSEE